MKIWRQIIINVIITTIITILLINNNIIDLSKPLKDYFYLGIIVFNFILNYAINDYESSDITLLILIRNIFLFLYIILVSIIKIFKIDHYFPIVLINILVFTSIGYMLIFLIRYIIRMLRNKKK